MTGTPVRGEFSSYSKQAAKAELGLPLDKPLVVSVWGSLGAENMNEVMCRFIELAGKKPGFTLIHSAGIEGYEKMVEHLRRTVVPRRSFNHIRAYIYAQAHDIRSVSVCHE